ncbi:MAG: flagellar biosynthetic protein FliO [Lachnospiraceae bacterium]|jgi:flagellar protein FliO/FliZ|nr:flagellar biosynthetic protein FliO [Lachnospiraceae bacterium]
MPGVLTGIVTFLLAAIIIYLSYICSKYLGKGLARGGSSQYMRMLDQLIVGQNRTLVIVQAGGRYLLLGVSSDKIETLAELSEEDLLPLGGGDQDTPMDFAQLLLRIGRKKNGREDEE